MNQVKKQPRKFSVLTGSNDRQKFVLPLDTFSNMYIQKNVINTCSDTDVVSDTATYDYETRYAETSNENYKNLFRLARMNRGRVIVPQLYNTGSNGSKFRLKLNDKEIHISNSLFDLLVSEFGLKYYIDENRDFNGYRISVVVISDDMIAEDLTESLIEVGRLVKVHQDSQIWGTETMVGYHYSAWHPKIASNFTKYMDKTIGAVNFGFEAEKQDYDFRDRDNAIKLAFQTGFKKERDGSLGDGGFELISPVLPLNDDNVINEVLAPVRDILDAGTTDKCGGHINVSINGQSSKDILKKVKGSLPIFYSIYEKRLNNTYCGAYPFSTYLRSPRKYQAFYLKNNDILEFRIFPAIKNNTILKNRIDLMRIVLNDLYGKTHNKVILEMAKKNSKLYNFMLNVVCNGDMDKFKSKIKSFIVMSAKYKCGIVTIPTIKKVEKMLSMNIITPVETAPATQQDAVESATFTSDDSYRQERSNDAVTDDGNYNQNIERFTNTSDLVRHEFNQAYMNIDISLNSQPLPIETLFNYIPSLGSNVARLSTPLNFSRVSFSSMLRYTMIANGGAMGDIRTCEHANRLLLETHTNRMINSCEDTTDSETYTSEEMNSFFKIFAMLITTARFTRTQNFIYEATFNLPVVSNSGYYMKFICNEDGTYICTLAQIGDGCRFVYIFNEHECSINILNNTTYNPF
jgi:hypothetical protein